MYVGRFAPSPTGPLHFGSLVAALASYLDAKAHNGHWLVRIEDLDTPRCQPEAIKDILKTLAAHGLVADGEMLMQSTRLADYQIAVDALLAKNEAYYCQCTRKQIKARYGVHDPECRHKAAADGAVRFKNDSPVNQFYDRMQGQVRINDAHALEDFVVLRRDGIFAYNLAVVLDDIAQGVTHIVRGDDLLETTSAHLSLYSTLGATPPVYLHIPVIKDRSGNKLSKQNHAPAIDNKRALSNLVDACNALELYLPDNIKRTNVNKILGFATQTWQTRWASSKLAHLN